MEVDGTTIAHDDTIAIGDVRDPYPVYEALRPRGGVIEVNLRAEFGLVEVQTMSPVREFAVISYDALRDAFADQRLSNAVYANYLGMVTGRSILEMDGPEHNVLRKTIASAFRPQALARWMDDAIRPTARQLAQVVAERGKGELVGDLAFQLPMRVICRMLGVPSIDWKLFTKWSEVFITVAWDPSAGPLVAGEMQEYMQALISQKRAVPGDDLTTLLCQATVDGRVLTDQEIVNFLRTLLPAGAETTFRGGSVMLFVLLSRLDLFQEVAANRSAVVPFVDEVLRWDPPTHSVPRIAAEDTVIGGVAIPAGSVVTLCPAAANRDPAVWDHPDRFDMHRPQKAPATFGYGMHYCLGRELARLEMTAMLDAVLDVLPTMRFAPDADDPHIYGMAMRAVNHLPVVT